MRPAVPKTLPGLTALAAGLLIAGAPGHAQPARSRLWQQAAIDPLELDYIAGRASELYRMTEGSGPGEDDDILRRRLLADARGMLRYALARDPEHLRSLEILAYVEEASGRMDQAVAAYERYLEVFAHVAAVSFSAELCVRYGVLLVRLERLPDAAAQLRQCVDGWPRKGQVLQLPSALRGQALVHLANIHVRLGRVSTATELLRRQAAANPDEPLLFYLLGVIYDKDRQISNAYEALDRARTITRGDLVTALGPPLEDMDFVPVAERHYHRALLFEISGYLPEAREEWHAYARSTGAADHAERARQHIRAIDGLRDREVRPENRQRPTP